jgi:RHS repeat-associated protein
MYSIRKYTGFLVTAIIILFYCKAGAQNINIPNKTGPMGTQVNTLTGNLFIPRNDLYLPARGYDFDIAFYYNSYDFDTTYGFGNGWSFGYSIKYKIDTVNNTTIIWGDGREDTYNLLSATTYKSPTGFFDTLTQYQPGKFLLSMLNGSKYYFDNSMIKKITKMIEPNGNFINFNYTNSLLSSITNSRAQSISFTYDGSGRLSSATDANSTPSRIWTYTYDQGGNLLKVTDPLGGTNKYSYLVNGPMKSMSDKNNNTVDIIYNPDFSVSEIIGCNKRQSFSYDTTLNKTIVTDYLASGNNQVTTYGYGKTNNQVWLNSLQSNCCGYNMTFKYDNTGNKIQQTDANGNITNYTFDVNGNLLTETDALNQTVSYTYASSFNNISSFTDASGNTTTLNYSSTGNLTQITEPGGLIYTAAYNTIGDIISSTDPLGNTYTYGYDAYGNPTNVTGPNGYNATLAFDARGNLLSFADARGNSSSLQYDILNRLKTITDPINNSIQFNYDAEGNITSFKDQNNNSSNFNYDASNRQVQFTDAANNKSTVSYDAMDNPTSIKDAMGNASNFIYDTRNRLSSITDALGNTSSLSYDPNGNIVTVNLPNGNQITYTYDAINRVTAFKDNSGTIANLSYDKNNNVTSYTNGTGATVTATYDNLDRVTQVKDPLGNYYSFTYDNNGNVTTVTDRNGFAKAYTYDGLNRVQTFIDNNGFIITLGYDAQSNVTSMKDQNNKTTSYTYDNFNRVISATYPNGKFIEYIYDSKGNIITKKLADGTDIKYVYDALNRVISKTLPSGIVYIFTYDALNRVIAATNDAGTVKLTYDALNRIVSEAYDNRTTYYNYNIAGRIQNIVYPDSTVITKNFDTRNRIVSILKNNTVLVSYQYNNADQVTVKTFANGVSTNLQYDFANRLSNISTASGVIQNSSFTYDKEINKTAINRINNPTFSEQYTYDNAYRITNSQKGTSQNTFTYDASGNRLAANINGVSSVYTINNLNQITNISGSQNSSLTYDNNGNLTFDGLFYKTYDAEGRLLKDSASPTNTIAYLYDAIGRRVQKTINAVPYKYTYSGVAQIEERDGVTSNLLNRTIFSGFITPVVNENNGQQYFYHQNELNSVEAITDNTGNVTETYQYDIYGKPTIYNNANIVIPASLAGNRFGFTGQEYDTATKSNHFFFRNYSTTTGTFNQRDLIGYADGTNMYQYVHDNPANGIDVLGLEDEDDVISVYDIFGKDPCFHDQEKIRLISQKIAKMELTNAITNANENKKNIDNTGYGVGAINYYTGTSWISYGINSDSRFYNGDLANLMGKNDYYFKGESMKSWELNYYFTNSSLAAGGFSEFSAQMNTGIWNDGKAYMSALNPFNWQKSADRLAEGDIKHRMSEEAYSDHDFGKINNVPELKREQDFEEKGDFGAFFPVINPKTGEISREFFVTKTIKRSRLTSLLRFLKNNCPQNGSTGGTEKKVKIPRYPGSPDSVEVVQAHDPNALIAPTGVSAKHWVSIKDNLPFTILYENSASASAPAKFVSITTPLMPKEDPTTFQLGSFGFNNLTFTVPPGTASYYQRLDARDSLGLFIDITAGFNQITNQAFWQFQSIDPLTLLPPSDPLKGFLLLQDSSKPLNGHGFVNFTIKSLQTDHTLDTIAPQASVVFDQNDTIPTNVTLNTIDALPPTSHMNAVQNLSQDVPLLKNSSLVKLSWSATDDPGGSGVSYYTVYVSTDQINYSILIPKISGTDTTLRLPTTSSYCFFVLATDSTGNMETLQPGKTQCFAANTALPVNWLYFTGNTIGKDNILNWATTNEIDSKQFNVERSFNSTSFNQIGAVRSSDNNSQTMNTYQFTDYGIDKLNMANMYYRLKQIDKDGNYTYSHTILLTYKQNNTGNSIVYPNPTPDLITILVGDNALIGSTAILYDINGRVLQNIKITNGSQQVNLSSFVNGTYIIKLKNGEKLKVVKSGY